LEKYASGMEVYALSNTDAIKSYVGPNNYYIYGEEESFTKSWVNAFDKLPIKAHKYFVYNQEDFILYDQVNVDMLDEAKTLVDTGINHFSKLIKSGGGEFCFQSTLNDVNKYINFLSKYPINQIWDEIQLSSKSVGEYECRYMPEEWTGFKRGLYHYDSKVWPYIATALNKGEWNDHEYPLEIKQIFDEFNEGKEII
jgi:hypothetical protein